MKQSIKSMLAGLLLVPMLVLGLVVATPVGAEDPATGGISGGASSSKSEEQPTKLFGDDSVFKNITNAALFIIGAISVLMLIYGGIRYTISGGDSNAVTAAKNTILYAVVGIVVAIMAYAIVNYVIGALVATP